MKVAYKDFFGLKVWVGITVNEKAYLIEMGRLKIKDPSPWLLERAAATTHFIDPDKSSSKHICLICIEKNLTRFGAYGLLVHEAVHVMQRIKEIFNEDKIGHEMEAYALQGIACFLWDEYDKQRKKK